MSSARSRVAHVELVRASATTSLLRIDVDGAPENHRDGWLVIRDATGRERRIPSLPTPGGEEGRIRYAFGIAPADRLAHLTIVIGSLEMNVAVPPERSREDAVATVALQRARQRLAELETALEEREASIEQANADGGRDRLEQQLAEHRLLRAQLTRELKAIRAQTEDMQTELHNAVTERDALAEQLENERAGSAAERERLTERLQTAHQRVEYLERRLVEVQAQGRATQRRR